MKKSYLIVLALTWVLSFSLSANAALMGTNFDIVLSAVVDTGGLIPFGLEGHTTTGLTFDGAAEPLPNNFNILGAQGFDLVVTDTVTTTGPMAESVEICVTNPDGGALFNDDLNLGIGPNLTFFNVTNMSWGAGAGPATVSNVEISYVDAGGGTVIVPFAPTVTGDGTTTPLGFTSTIPNADLENGMSEICLSFDVSHPVPEPGTLIPLLLGLALTTGRKLRRAAN